MRQFWKPIFMVLAILAAPASMHAFSLQGPFSDWQVERIGYNIQAADTIGGPMNLGEEYRWNIKTLTYGFDSSFLDYFGEQGRVEIRKAIAVLNAIPPVSQMSPNLEEFPLDTRRHNFQASALFLRDLKSTGLSILVAEMGLNSSERFTWCLRSRDELPGDVVQYTVIKRNFDPVTWSPSSYVNGTLYTYIVGEFFTNPDVADAAEIQVDPLAFGFNSVPSATEGLFAGLITAGEFITGLTRDDMGGLRYLYRPNNFNVETLINTNVTLTSSSPWTPIGGGTGTNTNTVVVSAVATALRPGIDKVTFLEGSYDSLLGSFITFTNSYTDSYVTNGSLASQTLQRVVTQPDILFAAQDLGVVVGFPVQVGRSISDGWINNDAINGAAPLDGPGVITPTVVISFSKIGPYFINQIPGFLDETSGFQGLVWGSFDGTTNAPIVYPNGVSIRELEQFILGGL